MPTDLQDSNALCYSIVFFDIKNLILYI